MHYRSGLLLYSVCKEVLENAMNFFAIFVKNSFFKFVFFMIIGQQDVKLGRNLCFLC